MASLQSPDNPPSVPRPGHPDPSHPSAAPSQLLPRDLDSRSLPVQPWPRLSPPPPLLSWPGTPALTATFPTPTRPSTCSTRASTQTPTPGGVMVADTRPRICTTSTVTCSARLISKYLRDEETSALLYISYEPLIFYNLISCFSHFEIKSNDRFIKSLSSRDEYVTNTIFLLGQFSR